MSKPAGKARRPAPQPAITRSEPLPPVNRPQWLTWSIVLLAAVAVFSRYWFGIGDSDFWWHLKTGQYIWLNHKLPVPDPFAYTTYLHPDAYSGESLVRFFNLTHEWLAQIAFYAVYSAGGATGITILRALALTLICGITGLIAWRRTAGFYRSVAVALLVMLSCTWIAGERPYLFTYVFLVTTLAILEYRRWLWALPPLFLVWANMHGAFFLGWIIVGAYCLNTLIARARGAATPNHRTLLICSAAAVLISGLNPNGFHIIQILLDYRNSPLQTSITEWQRPKYWELSTFTVILYGSLAALLWARGRARISDWLLYLLFAIAALSAVRNIILIGIIGPLILASYLPLPDPQRLLPTLRTLPATLAFAAVLALAARIVTMPHAPFNASDWRFSPGAADFLLQHHVTARIFNSYESGGYLIWRLWPQNQVFIDGRALSEATFADYRRIAFNADSSTGASSEQLLAQYKVSAIVMPMIDYSGKVYLLPAALSDPSQHEWKLVYTDPEAVIYMKDPPPGVTPLPPNAALSAMEAQCNLMLDRAGDDCARGVADLYSKIGDTRRAAQWMAVYQSRGGATGAQYGGLR
ncbi:MAG TPA: hypothetical protein VHW24_21170 [Bryobacteraceae bacterium]|nr:hypothetical protein [Bryobacteraceae bacterium]